MTSLQGKVIAITGAASGIGLATAHLLASRGATISISDVRADALEAAVEAIRKANPSIATVAADGDDGPSSTNADAKAKIFSQTVDVSKHEQVDAWIRATVAKFGKLHGAANIAGVFDDLPGSPVQEMSNEAWNRIIDINLHGVFFCLRSELKVLEEGGSVVNMSSICGLSGMPNMGPYAASKHAIIGLSKCAAKECFDRKIRVNCVAPGFVDTPALRAAGVTDELNLGPRIQRMGTAEEVAGVVAFLLGDESKYVTGSTYTIDGGLMA